jgi:ferredoxin
VLPACAREHPERRRHRWRPPDLRGAFAFQAPGRSASGVGDHVVRLEVVPLDPSTPGSVADVDAGTRILDACDDIGAPIAISCRAANCGVCRVRVLDGMALLAPAGAAELDVLGDAGAAPEERLACQLVVRGEGGLVRIAPLRSKPSDR